MAPDGSAAAPQDGTLGPLLGELSQVLQDEYAALSARDVERLETVVAHKTAIVDAIEHLLSTQGGAAAAELAGLRELVEACALGNRTNGGAIAMNQSLVGTLLDTLYGVSREGRTYAANGGFATAGAIRSVARA